MLYTCLKWQFGSFAFLCLYISFANGGAKMSCREEGSKQFLNVKKKKVSGFPNLYWAKSGTVYIFLDQNLNKRPGKNAPKSINFILK